MKLGDKSEIGIGLVLSRKKATINSGFIEKYKTITIKSINEFGEIDKNLLEELKSITYIDKNYITEEGDVLMRLTYPYTAIYIDINNSNLVIPSHFAKIRLNTEEIKPKFLAIYLNSVHCKRQILRNAVGSSLASITVKDIKDIKIKLYKKELQDKAISINDLQIEETKLMNELMRNQELFNTIVMKELLK